MVLLLEGLFFANVKCFAKRTPLSTNSFVSFLLFVNVQNLRFQKSQTMPL